MWKCWSVERCKCCVVISKSDGEAKGRTSMGNQEGDEVSHFMYLCGDISGFSWFKKDYSSGSTQMVLYEPARSEIQGGWSIEKNGRIVVSGASTNGNINGGWGIAVFHFFYKRKSSAYSAKDVVEFFYGLLWSIKILLSSWDILRQSPV